MLALVFASCRLLTRTLQLVREQKGPSWLNLYSKRYVHCVQQTRLIIGTKFLSDPFGPFTNDSQDVGAGSHIRCAALSM